MIIKPRIRGFICTTAHPAGCAAQVQQQAEWERRQPAVTGGPKNVLIIGGSGGYGLASRIVAAFGYNARTLCLSFEKEPEAEKTATAGYYNNAAFDRLARAAGLYARSMNADAFTDATRAAVADVIRQDLGQIDLLIYSLASPVRTDPETGVLYRSAIKPVGAPVHMKSLNVDKGIVGEVDIAPATDDEIASTVKVMGGEDWERWIDRLGAAGVLSPGCKTTTYTYVGEQTTRDVYWDGTIGAAKKDLDRAAASLRGRGFDASVSVLKAVVTQASAAIPAMPLYLAVLFKVMKQHGTHEGCIEQIHRLFTECLYNANPRRDEAYRFRVDDKELRREIQGEVEALWPTISNENLNEVSDFRGFRADFLKLFGFGVGGVDYDADVEVDVKINHLTDLSR